MVKRVKTRPARKPGEPGAAFKEFMRTYKPRARDDAALARLSPEYLADIGARARAADKALRLVAGDRREARYALRIHPDLKAELGRLARSTGVKVSTIVERAIIKAVNDSAGKPVVDAIGRYIKSTGKR